MEYKLSENFDELIDNKNIGAEKLLEVDYS